MTFHFSCPQGHVLEGELSQIGQLFQCPFCGESFSIPSPNPGMGGEFLQGPPGWPGAQPPQGFSTQPFAPLQPAPTTKAESESERPKFDLGFDPLAKAPLPFDIHESPSDKFSSETPPVDHPTRASGEIEPVPTLSPLPAESPSEQKTPVTDFASMIDEPMKVQVLHIRCPVGHALKVSREQHGKPVRCSICKQVFEVRYENSLEFQQRTDKVLSQASAKSGQMWLAFAIVAAVAAIAGLIALVVYANRGG